MVEGRNDREVKRAFILFFFCSPYYHRHRLAPKYEPVRDGHFPGSLCPYLAFRSPRIPASSFPSSLLPLLLLPSTINYLTLNEFSLSRRIGSLPSSPQRASPQYPSVLLASNTRFVLRELVFDARAFLPYPLTFKYTTTLSIHPLSSSQG